MSTALALRVVLKVARVALEVWVQTTGTGEDKRRAYVLQLVRKGIARRERKVMRDLYNDEAFIAAVGQMWDAVKAILDASIRYRAGIGARR